MEFGIRGADDAGSPGSGGHVKETDTQSFAADVIEASKNAIVLVDFWADWCGPCKQLGPILEKVVNSYGGKVKLVKLNVDQHPAIPGQLRIQSLPTVYAFKDGRPLDGFMGALPESGVKEFIDKLLGDDAGSDVDAVLAQADALVEAGDLQGAVEIYAGVLQDDRQNVSALVGLAKCYLKSGSVARAEQTVELIPPDKRESQIVKSVVAAIELEKQAADGGSTSELEAKLQSNPGDHQARLDLAIALAARGQKALAVDHLIALFKADKAWNDEAAKKQLLQFFDAWGPQDPDTIQGRRKLSSLLFS